MGQIPRSIERISSFYQLFVFQIRHRK